MGVGGFWPLPRALTPQLEHTSCVPASFNRAKCLMKVMSLLHETETSSKVNKQAHFSALEGLEINFQVGGGKGPPLEQTYSQTQVSPRISAT